MLRTPPSPQTHTTTTLRSFLQTVTQILSTHPHQPSKLATHTLLKLHIQKLVTLIQQTLQTHITVLTESLQTRQSHNRNLTTTLSTLSEELSHHTSLRARYFEESVHYLTKLTTPVSSTTTPESPLGFVSLSFLPFVKPAGEFGITPEKSRRRFLYTSCVASLKDSDDTVRALQRTKREIVKATKELRISIRRDVDTLKRMIRCRGEWVVVNVVLNDFDHGFEELHGVLEKQLAQVIGSRWERVFESLGSVGQICVDVEDVEDVIWEIRGMVKEVCSDA